MDNYTVVNPAFNESTGVMLQNVLGMTAGRTAVPPIKSRDFTLTSKSDAV